MKIDPRLYCFFGADRTDEIYEMVQKFSKSITIHCHNNKRVSIKGLKILLEVDGKEEVVITEDFKEKNDQWVDLQTQKSN